MKNVIFYGTQVWKTRHHSENDSCTMRTKLQNMLFSFNTPNKQQITKEKNCMSNFFCCSLLLYWMCVGGFFFVSSTLLIRIFSLIFLINSIRMQSVFKHHMHIFRLYECAIIKIKWIFIEILFTIEQQY